MHVRICTACLLNIEHFKLWYQSHLHNALYCYVLVSFSLMDKKDSERGEEMVRQCATMTSKRNQKSCCMQPSTCIIVFLLVLTLSVSLLALCVSLLSYWQVNMEGKQKQLPMTAATGQPVVDEEEMEKTVLYKVSIF